MRKVFYHSNLDMAKILIRNPIEFMLTEVMRVVMCNSAYEIDEHGNETRYTEGGWPPLSKLVKRRAFYVIIICCTNVLVT